MSQSVSSNCDILRHANMLPFLSDTIKTKELAEIRGVSVRAIQRMAKKQNWAYKVLNRRGDKAYYINSIPIKLYQHQPTIDIKNPFYPIYGNQSKTMNQDTKKSKPQQKSHFLQEGLRKLRHALPAPIGSPVSQQTVANAAGISLGSYQRAESGIVPGEMVLNRIAKYYGVSIDYLLTGKTDASTNEPPPKPHGVAHFYGVAKAPAAQTQSQPTPKPDQESPFLQPMSMLSEILASGDPILVPAIQANLRAFQSAVRDKQRLSIQSAHCVDVKIEG